MINQQAMMQVMQARHEIVLELTALQDLLSAYEKYQEFLDIKENGLGWAPSLRPVPR